VTTTVLADVAAAGPRWIRELLTTVPGQVPVLHSGPDAVYLDVGDDVIAVLSRRAVLVPGSLHTTLTSTGELTLDGHPPLPGSPVTISGGALHFSGARVRVGRISAHPAPAIDPGAASRMASRLAPALGSTHAARAELPASALRDLAAADARAVTALLGLGSGLTPLGDDVLSGWLATVVAATHPCAARIGHHVLALAGERTTALSATLLRRAVHGETVPQFAELLHALSAHPERVAPAVADLTGIGHTSGHGLALGLSLALDHLRSRSTCS